MRIVAIVIIVVLALMTDAKAQEFACTVESVTDGDTFRCTDGKKVRIWGIDAPEIDVQQGPASKAALSDILDGQVVLCIQKGTSHDRIVASCHLEGHDIGALMVSQAAARDCPRFSGGAYAQLEDARHLELPMGDFCWP